MNVKVFGTLRSIIGEKELEISLDQEGTIGAMLDQLTITYPKLQAKLIGEEETPPTGVNILVNGRSIRFLDGLNTSVEEDDEVALFPPLGGG
jgi:molybdopterin synthase sulfur carrier subunit